MYAMQYEITLPADYDMRIIRERVAIRGAALDNFAGLGLKAYLMREADTDGSPINAYAPFYLWTDTTAMGRFLWSGGGFEGIVTSFGRPTVRHWAGTAFLSGTGIDAVPVAASRRYKRIDPHVDPTEAVADALTWANLIAEQDTIHSVTVAVDPTEWEIVTFVLWTARTRIEVDAGDRYEVVHLSKPGLDVLRSSGG